MTILESAVILAVGIWLLVLSIVSLLLVRQVSLITVRLSIAVPHVVLDEDGPDLGFRVPEGLFHAIQGADSVRDLIFLSATCSPCRSLASELSSSAVTAPTLALITGREEVASAVADLLPEKIERVLDPLAAEITAALDVSSMPFGIRVSNGVVEAKAYLHAAGDFARLVGAEEFLGHRLPVVST
jgi:hypothetical protein